ERLTHAAEFCLKTIDQIAAMLAAQPLLASLNEEARLRIAKSCEVIRFRAGAGLMPQGETGKLCVHVAEGRSRHFCGDPCRAYSDSGAWPKPKSSANSGYLPIRRVPRPLPREPTRLRSASRARCCLS